MPARPISPLRTIQFGVSVVVRLAAAICASLYWDYQQRKTSTDDAYVQANIVGIAAQVGGQHSLSSMLATGGGP